MQLFVILSLLFPIIVSAAEGADSPAAKDELVGSAIKQLLDGQRRVFGKAVRLCASREAAESISIARAFEQYQANLASGTRAGLSEVKAVEWFTSDQAIYSDEVIAMQNRQGDMLAESIKTAEVEVCDRLYKNLRSRSEAFFRDFTIQGYTEYLQKRKVFCSQLPRPVNCKPGE
jgi:hypothetical protein